MTADRWYDEACKMKKLGDHCAAKSEWRGAYREYGSAVEYLIKAIYLRNTQQNEMPPDLRKASSHDIAFMAKHAGLLQEIETFHGAMRLNWLVVRDWDQGKRYPNHPFPAQEGKDYKQSLLNPTHGIWQWLLNQYHQN